MAYGFCLGTSSWGQDKFGATGGIKASHRSWNVVGWSLACRINRWAVNSTLKILSHNSLIRGLCCTLADELSSFAFFFSLILSRQPLSMQQQPYHWCWTSSDLPAESPKSRHHPQEVKDRTIPLLWFSAVTTAYTTSTLHTEIMIWNRKIALSQYNTALFYSVNVLHLHAGSLEPMVLGPISHQIPFPQTAQTGRGANSENI